MKKIQIVLTLATVFSYAVLQSCAPNSQAKEEMQKPTAQELATTTATEPAATEAAPDANVLTNENLLEAFKGETTASAKYEAYSKKAEQEGFHEIALMFKAASMSENIHANNHKVVIEESGAKAPVIKPEFKVNSTKENLQDALAGESYEISTMYPEFITNANAADNQLALVSFNYAYKTEKKHKALYEKALAALDNNSVKTLSSVFYVCPTCGNTYDINPSKRCGISMTSSEKFIKITNLSS